jgi:hypothetical protein
MASFSPVLVEGGSLTAAASRMLPGTVSRAPTAVVKHRSSADAGGSVWSVNPRAKRRSSEASGAG